MGNGVDLSRDRLRAGVRLGDRQRSFPKGIENCAGSRRTTYVFNSTQLKDLVGGQPREPVDAAGAGQSLELVLASVF